MEAATQPVATCTLARDQFPDQPNLTISDSSFFRKHQAFPSIDEIRRQANLNTGPKEDITTFPHLQLLVKSGRKVHIAEGQCLYAIRRLFGDRVPVPEVYGWRTENGIVSIFMQLVSGTTLEARWGFLTDAERFQVCKQLREMLEILRSAQQPGSERFIGQINGRPLQETAFPPDVIAGPFPSVVAFNDWFSMLYRRHLDDPTAYPADPYRHYLPDGVPIKFTHGDLHPSNIMVSSTGPPQVISIIDWQKSGWLPEFWEVCKAMYTAIVGDEWSTRFIPMFLDERQDTWEAWSFYVAANGN